MLALIFVAGSAVGADLETKKRQDAEAQWMISKAIVNLALGKEDRAFAEKYFRSGVESARALNDPARLAETLVALAVVEMGIGKYQAAHEELVEALQLTEVDKKRAVILLLLGKAANYSSDPSAEKYFVEAKKILESSGPIRTATGIAWYGIGHATLLRSNYVEAQQAFEKALEIFENPVGRTWVDGNRIVRYSDKVMTEQIVAALSGLGLASQGLHDVAAATAAFNRAINLIRGEFGEKSPMLAPPLANLARLDLERGNLRDAETSLVKFKRLVLEHTTENDPIRLELYRDEAELNERKGDTNAMIGSLVMLVRFGIEQNNLNLLAYSAKKLESIQTTDREAAKGFSSSARAIAEYLAEHGNSSTAAKWDRFALKAAEVAYGENSLFLVSMLRDLGRYEVAHGKAGDGIQYFQRELAIMEKSFGPGDSRVATVLEDFAGALRLGNQTERAAEIEKRAQDLRIGAAPTPK